MVEHQLTITTDERDFLVNLLQSALKEARVEEHRTRAPSFRELILKKEQAMIDLLTKLGSGVKNT